MMNKLLFTLALTLGFTLSASALQPLHKLFAVRQSDGTTVQLYKHGDSGLAFYTTEDDRVVVRDEAGTLVYARLADNRLTASTVRVHNLAERTAEEKAFAALTPRDLPQTALRRTVRRRDHVASTADGLGKYGTSAKGAVPTIGDITIPVIMVEFADRTFQPSTTPELMTRFYNEEGFDGAGHTPYAMTGSVRDYFLEQSRGMFRPSFNVVARVQLSRGYAYYGKNKSQGTGDSRAVDMVAEAVETAVAQGVDFTPYKVGTKIPLVSILYAGVGEATSDDEDAIWPHEYDLYQGINSMGGYTFGSYFVGNELYYSNNLMGMGTFVHEFSHALGLPDFYDTEYTYQNNDSFGMWSVMDHGPYNDDSYNPVCYTAYERSFCGWLNIPALTAEEGCKLVNPYDGTGDYARLVRSPKSNVEYFILENRQQGRWAPTGSGSGLMVTRIKYYDQAWYANTVNNAEDKQRAKVITANGAKIDNAALSAHLYGNGVSDILTLPLYAGTTLSTAPVYQVMKHSGGTISMSFKARNLYTETAENGQYFALVSSLDELQSGDSVIIVNDDEHMTLSTQGASGYRPATTIKVSGSLAYGNDDALVLKAIRAANGTQWGFAFRSGNKNYYLACGSGGALTTVTKASATCLATIDIQFGLAAITFGGTQSANTLSYTADATAFKCLTPDEGGNVNIYRKIADPTPVVAISAAQPASEGIYTLGGQYVGTQLRALPRGVYIVGGRKVVK